MSVSLARVFAQLDFPKHADRIYDALSKSPAPLLVMAIAQAVGVSRVVVYRALAHLTRHGLVGVVPQGGRTAYFAEPLSRVRDLVKTADRELRTLETHYTPETSPAKSLRYIRGATAVAAVFDDVVAHTPRGDTFYRYTSEQDLDAVNKQLSPEYRRKRDQKKLERLVISNARSGKAKRARLERFIKYFPADVDQFEQNIIQLVYSDRVAMVDLTKEEAFIIDNKALADFQKVIFKALYRRLDRR